MAAEVQRRRMSQPISEALVEREHVLDYGRGINWRKYVDAGAGGGRRGDAGAPNVFLDDANLDSLMSFADIDADAMEEMLNTSEEGAGHAYAMTLLKVASNISDARVLRYVVTLVEDLLAQNTRVRAALFVRPGSPVPETAALLRLLAGSTDAYVLNKVVTSLAYLVSVRPDDATAAATLLAWILRQLQVAGSGGAALIDRPAVRTAVSGLSIILRSDEMREAVHSEHGVERLIPLLATSNVQLLYEVAFCMWAMSLHEPALPLMVSCGAIKALVRLVRTGQRDKVLRMAFAAMANAVRGGHAPDADGGAHSPFASSDDGDGGGDAGGTAGADGASGGAAAGARVSRKAHDSDDFEGSVTQAALSVLSCTPLEASIAQIEDERKITDEEMAKDAAYLKEMLSHSERELSSMEQYLTELDGGLLDWSPVHTTEFWKEHIRSMEAHDFGPLRRLRDLIDTSDDITTLAVACFDVGEFARHHLHGRTILKELGLRDRVMALLSSDVLELKKQALLCCSKLMVENWQFVK